MILLTELRESIRKTLTIFERDNQPLSYDRKRDIKAIRALLTLDNPITLRAQLQAYTNNLSHPLLYAFWPLFEVNKFKYALERVLNLPQFQEIAMLQALLQELAGAKTSDAELSPFTGDKHPLIVRIERLEQGYATQADHIKRQGIQIQQLTHEAARWKGEADRLRKENAFLLETVEVVEKKYIEVKEENKTLAQDKTRLTEQVQSAEDRYAALLQENLALKQKLGQLAGQPFTNPAANTAFAYPPPSRKASTHKTNTDRTVSSVTLPADSSLNRLPNSCGAEARRTQGKEDPASKTNPGPRY